MKTQYCEFESPAIAMGVGGGVLMKIVVKKIKNVGRELKKMFLGQKRSPTLH